MKTKFKIAPHARLKAFRASFKLSMADMCKVIGTTECSYLAKENGERDFKESEMKAIYKFANKYTNITSDELFFT